MTMVSSCPDSQLLQQLLMGLLTEEQAQSLEEHLSGCPHCSQLVAALSVEDPVAFAVRSGAAMLADVDHPLVQRVIQRLGMLPVSLTPVGQDTADLRTKPGNSADPRRPAEVLSDLTEDGFAFLAPPQGPGELGRLGGYRVLRVLGQGGMGVVFLAEDVHLQRLVALKVMRPTVARAGFRERFLHEARVCASLKHDHIVAIYQVGEDRGVPFLVMEFLEGMSLDRFLERGRRPTVSQILGIGKQVARGLAAAHAKGLIHRDIKPANIWLDQDSNRVKILDFGLARAKTDDRHLTVSGAVVGTPAYMAPEQARGEALDARCDLFSLGCVLYRLCTGMLPFTGDTTMAVLLELATRTPRPVREVNPAMPPALSHLIDRLLAKDPADRPASAAEVLQALQKIEDGLSETTAVSQPIAVAGKSRRSLLIAAVLGLVVVGGVLAVGLWLLHNYRDTQQPTATGVVEGTPPTSDSGSRPAATPNTPKPPPPVPQAGSPYDVLRREDIPADELAAAGGGDPLLAPQELVAVLRQKALYNHQYPAIGFDLSPDGNTVAYNFGGPRVYLWDVAARTERTLDLPRQAGREARCPWLTFSPDGKKLALATGQSFGLVVVWDLDRAAIQHELRIEKQAVECVAFSPDGRTLAGISIDRQIRLWNVATGQQVNVFGEKITGLLRFSPDGQVVATLNEGRLAFYDFASGQLRQHLVSTPRDFCFSPDGRTMAAANASLGNLQILDPVNGKVLRTTPLGRNVVNSVAYARSGTLLAAREFVGAVWLWDADTGQERARIPLKHKGQTGAVRFSPDGRHLLTANTDGSIYILRLPPEATRNQR